MEKINQAVEKHKALILEAERYIWEHPQTGFREFETSRYLEEKFEKLGYNLVKAGDIPGFYAVLDTGKPGPEVLVLGELDSLICPNHKDAQPETGYVHACGHNVQCATILGVAAALKEPGVLDGLCGRIRLCAVPAEELIEIEYRARLKENGLIHYHSGKGEFLYRGYFDGVDMAFMVHASNETCAVEGAVGCIAKTVLYKGVSAHAGGCPWEGKNALYAAMQGLNAANALRETFQEKDLIRFHPIITHGGEAVNAIPELVKMEAFVRGKTYEAMLDANRRINQALSGGALSMGVNVEIRDVPGYSPLINNPEMLKVAKEGADAIIPEENFCINPVYSTGSTDMAELCALMPVIHPYIGGITGKAHGDDFAIADPERACVKCAKWEVAMLKILLKNNGARAKEIIENFTPTFENKEAYFAFVDSINAFGDRICYEEKSATVKL